MINLKKREEKKDFASAHRDEESLPVEHAPLVFVCSSRPLLLAASLPPLEHQIPCSETATPRVSARQRRSSSSVARRSVGVAVHALHPFQAPVLLLLRRQRLKVRFPPSDRAQQSTSLILIMLKSDWPAGQRRKRCLDSDVPAHGYR